MINTQDQQNGNTQVNTVRNDFNDRVRSKKFLGATPRVYWNNSRRFRTI
tara:strand:- start:857 stop:1003 length:147 start_codon:yes stop_codon:yes gene_type:complete